MRTPTLPMAIRPVAAAVLALALAASGAARADLPAVAFPLTVDWVASRSFQANCADAWPMLRLSDHRAMLALLGGVVTMAGMALVLRSRRRRGAAVPLAETEEERGPVHGAAAEPEPTPEPGLVPVAGVDVLLPPEAVDGSAAQRPLLPTPVRAAEPGDTVPMVRAPWMPELPRRLASTPYQHIATDELLALARQLAERDVTPRELLSALTMLGLPIEPLPDDRVGVVSVTGNSVKGWNEDAAVAFRSSHALFGQHDVMMCFDGMGGVRDGKLASRFAALSMAIELHRTPDTVSSDLQLHLAAAFERVNRRFRKAAQALYGQVEANALRSTAIVLLAEEARYVIGHQGDGHAHLRRADGTIDTLLQPHRGLAGNAVTRSLGPVPDGEAAVHVHPRHSGDLVYIASDGFDPVPPMQLLGVMHAFGGQHSLQTLVVGLTEECCRQRDVHGPIADDNMSLVAMSTPLAAELTPEPAAAAAC